MHPQVHYAPSFAPPLLQHFCFNHQPLCSLCRIVVSVICSTNFVYYLLRSHFSPTSTACIYLFLVCCAKVSRKLGKVNRCEWRQHFRRDETGPLKQKHSHRYTIFVQTHIPGYTYPINNTGHRDRERDCHRPSEVVWQKRM